MSLTHKLDQQFLTFL